MDVVKTYTYKAGTSDAIMNWIVATFLPAAVALILKLVGTLSTMAGRFVAPGAGFLKRNARVSMMKKCSSGN